MAADLDREQRFESIIDIVNDPLQRYLRRRASVADASELLNDVLTVIWRRLDEVPGDNPLPWCYGVAARCLSNQRRGEHRRLRLVRRIEAQPRAPMANGPVSEREVQLANALDRLGVDDRELIRLWAWEQLEPREIGVVLQIDANVASVRLTRARQKIATMLGEEFRNARQDPVDGGQERVGHAKEHR